MTGRRAAILLLFISILLIGASLVARATNESPGRTDAEYLNAVHGSWVATMVANHSGLPIEGIWLDEPGPGNSIELLLLDQWSTDDDTHVEWLDLHILETYGARPTYDQIRQEWIDHLNGDIWVATRRARDLMDQGIVPPATGEPEHNPEGAWAMDAQLETELFGLLWPNNPDEARRQARYFGAVTSSGPALDASAFYAHLYSRALYAEDIADLIDEARAAEPNDSIVAPIVDDVQDWHRQHGDDWRSARERIREKYDTDPKWWASRVNFAATIMSLLYGNGDLTETATIAGLAGWDADNNMTPASGLLGLTIGFDDLPEPWSSATDVYFNEDLSGDLPQFDSVRNIAQRTVALSSR